MIGVTLGVLVAVIVVFWGIPELRGRLEARAAEKRSFAAFEAGDFPTAEHAWLAAITAWPLDSNAYSSLGDMYHSLGKEEAAAACFQRLAEISPGFPHIYCRLAVAAEDSSAHAEALQDARLELERDPNCPRALDLLSVMDKRGHSRERAQEEAERAYLAAPTDELAITTYAQGFVPEHPEKVIEILAKARPGIPNSWLADYLLGWAYGHSMTDTDGMAKDESLQREAEKLDPGSSDVHRELCRLLLAENHPQEAAKEGALAMQAGPYNPANYVQAARALERAGRAAEANQASAHARDLQTLGNLASTVGERVKENPTDPALVHSFASLVRQLGNPRTAIHLTQTALLAHPGNAQLANDLANLTRDASSDANSIPHASSPHPVSKAAASSSAVTASSLPINPPNK